MENTTQHNFHVTWSVCVCLCVCVCVRACVCVCTRALECAYIHVIILLALVPLFQWRYFHLVHCACPYSYMCTTVVLQLAAPQVRFLPSESVSASGHCDPYPFQHHLRHKQSASRPHAEAYLQTLPSLLQLACESMQCIMCLCRL